MNLDARREDIRQGRVGSMLNVLGADATREMQDLALQSRLKIPMVFGYDVIHGLRTDGIQNLPQELSENIISRLINS